MNDTERKRNNLLEYLLEQISDAMGSYSDCEMCDDLFVPGFHHVPIFELDEEDMEIIQNIADNNISCKYIVDAYKSVSKNFTDK